MRPYSLLVAVPCLFCAAAAAQDATNAPAAGEALSAQQARDDVRLLRTLAQLDITTGQIPRIIPYLEQIQAHLSTISQRRDKTYGQHRTALENVRTAVVEGRTPRQSAVETIQRALRQLQLSIQIQMQRVLQEEAGIQAELTEQQLGSIETREQRDARLERVRELEGQTTAAAYVVKKLQEIRELLPDEYAHVRLRLANEIAVKTEGPRSPRFNPYRQRALAMMDQAYRWTVVEFQGYLPTLDQSVATTLGIRPDADAPSAEGLIPYEEYAGALRDPRTLALLRQIIARRGGGAGD
ncbi:MAG: hypothetical protein PVH68_07610 [Armatimonadota bacterium]|jgi:hypothetical protein